MKKSKTAQELQELDQKLCTLIKGATLYRYLGEGEDVNETVYTPLQDFAKYAYEMENCLFIFCNKQNKDSVYMILQDSNLFDSIGINADFDGGFHCAIINTLS